MRTWNEFLDEADRIDVAGRHPAGARATFELWARSAEERVLSEIRTEADRRASTFAERTGAVIQVEGTVTRAPPLPHFQSNRWRTVSLRLGASRVDLYSVRELGRSPAVHLAVLRAATSTRFPVLTTLPGALVVRAQNSDPRGFELLSLPLATGDRDRARTTIDALVLRAFELLVGTHRSVREFERRT